MQRLYPDPSPCRTSPPETWLPSQPLTTPTLLSPHPPPRPAPEELSSARIQTPPPKGLAPARTPQPGSGQIMRPHPRCLRGPHLLPLPLTPVGPEGPGQLRLSVPGNTRVELAAAWGVEGGQREVCQVTRLGVGKPQPSHLSPLPAPAPGTPVLPPQTSQQLRLANLSAKAGRAGNPQASRAPCSAPWPAQRL